MTEVIYRTLITLSGIASGIGAFILSADAVPFGLDAYDVGLSFVWAGTITTLIATPVRNNWIPRLTTGVGNE